ncbi:MAG: IreB family regulatory phosphoprotein [Limnochordia bacterium]|jgi:uncharacterized protein (UPF0297 family)|nr:IreB family regulatory phosphoprotein [Limnochordia bacterium]
MTEHDKTVMFRMEKEKSKAAVVLASVYEALEEKGYNPVSQIVGYLISGDPAFITSHGKARSLIRTVERDELLEELVECYLKNLERGKK